MPDPISLSLLTEIILRQAPTWFSAIQESLFSKVNDFALSKGRSFTFNDKQHLQHLELALEKATERGLASFSSQEEQSQYRNVIQVLSESNSEGIAGEAAKLFTIGDDPDLVLLSQKYNRLQRISALGQKEPFADIDATPYLSSFFKALVVELYNDPLFHERVSDVIKVRAALKGQQTISHTVHIEQQEVFMGDKVEGNKPTVTNTTHIGSVTGQVHTGEGDINVGSFSVSSGGAVSTKEEFLSALREFMAEVEAARQKGLPEETADDTLTEVEAAVREANKDSPKSNRVVERLNNAKSILIAGTGVAAAASQLIPLIEGAIQSVSKVFM